MKTNGFETLNEKQPHIHTEYYMHTQTQKYRSSDFKSSILATLFNAAKNISLHKIHRANVSKFNPVVDLKLVLFDLNRFPCESN